LYPKGCSAVEEWGCIVEEDGDDISDANQDETIQSEDDCMGGSAVGVLRGLGEESDGRNQVANQESKRCKESWLKRDDS
jgi:hypothetical protein